MSLLDPLFASGAGVDPAIITNIHTQLAAAQALIAAQQTALTTLGASVEQGSAAQALIDAAQQAAHNAQQTTIDTITGQLTTALPRVDAAHARRRRMDVRDFTPSGNLTDDVIADVMEAARLAAFAETSEGAAWCYNVYVPAGRYNTGSAKFVFPGTGINTPTPGLVGDGDGQTVFQSSLAPGEYWLTLGGAGDASPDYTFRQNIGDFSLVAAGGASYGGGINARLTYQTRARNILVQGFQQLQDANGGIGINMSRPNGAMSNHQHPDFRRVFVHTCQTGWRIKAATQGMFVNCGAHFSTLHTMRIEGSQFAWLGGNMQAGPSADPARWLGNQKAIPIVTGWDHTDGLGAGTGATLTVQSGGLCTVGALTGRTMADVGRWIILGGGAGNVAGPYRIEHVLSPTQVIVHKGSNHGAQTGLTWQIAGTAGGSHLLFDALAYDEGPKFADFFFGRDELSHSTYSVNNFVSANTQYVVDAAGAGTINVQRCAFAGGKSIRARECLEVEIDHGESSAAVDGYTQVGLYSRHEKAYPGYGNIRAGIKDSSGGRSRRMRSLIREFSPAAEIWDPRVASSFVLSGTNIQQCAGLTHGSVLTEVHAGVYAQRVFDAAFGQHVIRIVGNADGNLVGGLKGVIAAAGIGASLPYGVTIVAVMRLESVDVNDGLSASPTNRCISVTSSDLSRQTRLQFHDGVYQTAGHYLAVYSDTASFLGAGIRTTEVFPGDIDLLPHTHVAGTSGRMGMRYSTDAYGATWRSGGSNAILLGHGAGADLAVAVGDSGSAVGIGSTRIALLAVIPRDLSEAEQQQLVETSYGEWPIAV